MKKKITISVLLVGVLVSSIAYAFSGHPFYKGDRRSPRYELLTQLPEDKEMLFHKTMREAKGKAVSIREEIKKLRAEIKDILVAREFNEALFVEKTKKVHELQGKKHNAMDEAFVKLAKQFTPEERKILVQLIPHRHGRYGCAPGGKLWRR